MRSWAAVSALLLASCASGGGDADDAGGGAGPRDADPVEDAAQPDGDDAGMEARDAGNVIRLPDAGMMSTGCAAAADGTSCDADGDGCTVGDRCMSGTCVAGPREDCGGGSSCGAGSCVSTSASTFRCEMPAGGGSCDDGDACTTGDTCGADGTCAGTPVDGDGYEGNDTRGAAHDLGSVSDRDSFPSGTLNATLHPSGDEDWYTYYDSDDFGGLIYPRVDLSGVPSGSDYDLCAYYSCGSVSCESGMSDSADGLQGCCSRAAGSSNESVRLNPDCSGSDDSGTVYVRVWRHSGAATCGSYTLSWGDD